MRVREDSFWGWLSLPGPMLLALAHLAAVTALILFGIRTGNYPLHWAGVMLYGVTVAAAALGLAWLIRQGKIKLVGTGTLFWLSLPALAALAFRAGLWMTPLLGGAPFAPYDPGEAVVVQFFMLSFAAVLALAAILHGNLGYLLAAFAIQLVLYVGTQALPALLRYPPVVPVDWLGPEPLTPVALVGIYGLGAVLLLLRTKLVPRGRAPGLWLAATLPTLAGAFVLYHTLTWLPRNGAQLGYISATTYVPENAWNWIRSLAQNLAIVAMVGTAVTGLLAWPLHTWSRHRPVLERG
jgi:hypothetical protein